jgi:hypothetical protein
MKRCLLATLLLAIRVLLLDRRSIKEIIHVPVPYYGSDGAISGCNFLG